MSDKQYSVVIPVYNSEKTLCELTERLTKVFSALDVKFEIIFVDDCSPDKSWQVLKELYEKYDNLKIIHLLKNYGQHNATLAGFNYAKGDYIIIMDDDLQHPPEEIPKLINKIQEGYSVVYGRYLIKHHSRIENCFSNLFQKFIRKILEIPSNILTSSFAIFSSDVVKNLIQIKSSYVFLAALVMKCVPTSKITNVEVNHDHRKVGTSNYNIGKYLSLSLNLIINYSILPLSIVGFLGLFISFISILYAFYIFIHSIFDPSYGLMGWNSTIVAITFIGGTILFSISLIGEYLHRILTEVSYGQQFVIEEMEL